MQRRGSGSKEQRREALVTKSPTSSICLDEEPSAPLNRGGRFIRTGATGGGDR